MPPDDQPWRAEVARCVSHSPRPLHLVGVGNPLRRDDGAGIEVAISVRRALRGSGVREVKVHEPSLSPERTLAAIPQSDGLVIFDAVDAGLSPGGVVCASMASTDYGFFATHNLPLRLIPGVNERKETAYIVGVEPESVEFGEGLTEKVRVSVDAVAKAVVEAVAGSHG